MVRTSDPAVRARLLERAAQMQRDREPVTLRSLVAGTGVSTMAVYTHFGGMDGLWKALRQQGFVHLAERFAAVGTTGDPVADLTRLLAEYTRNALEHPDLYRVMFDATVELEDLAAADATLEHLVQAALRGVRQGRFRAGTVPLDLATQAWMVVHGVVSLVATGPLPPEALRHAGPLLTALLAGAGDDLDRCRSSVGSAWDL